MYSARVIVQLAAVNAMLIDPVWLGKFDWGIRSVIIFQYVQFGIRLAAVSYRGKKVRTVVSPAVRSVNKSLDTRTLRPKRTRLCDLCHFRHPCILQSPRNIFCALIWQFRHNYNRLDDYNSDVTSHRKMSALGTAGAMVTTHEIYVMMWSFKWSKLFSVL